MKAYFIQLFIFRLIQILLFGFLFQTGAKFFVIDVDSKRSLVQVLQLGLVLIVQVSVFIILLRKKYFDIYKKWLFSFKPTLHPFFGIMALLVPISMYFTYISLYSGQYNGFDYRSFLFHIIFFFFGALTEELIFRGYFYKLMIKKYKKFAAGVIVFQAAIFSFTHMLSPQASWVMFLNIFIAGLILGIIATRGFVYALMFHFLWNLLQGFFLGLTVSGYSFSGSMNSLFDAPPWENSYLALIVLGVTLVPFLVFFFKQKRKFV